jgi:pSer/pThr/pTyr-binding forkhead associated (FHA) protein
MIMLTTVRLTVQTGPHKDKKFCFCGASKCFIGRAPDCFVQLAGAARDRTISRHHCELAIDPPSIRIKDLGSRNGTYINGKPVEAIKSALKWTPKTGPWE